MSGAQAERKPGPTTPASATTNLTENDNTVHGQPTADGGESGTEKSAAPTRKAGSRGAKEANEANEVLRPVPESAIFTGVLGEIVSAARPHTEADPIGVLVSLLAGVGVALGQRPHVMIGSTRHPLLVWTLLFGKTGSGRKGDAANTARLFLTTAVADMNDISKSGLSSGEGLIEELSDPQDENDEGGRMDKRLLLTESEFSSVMARTKRDGSSLAAVMRQAWDGGALHVLNRKALSASGSHVAIVGHVTPLEFRKRLAEAELSGGTYNRFLPVYVERSQSLPLPRPIEPSVLGPLADRLGKAIQNGRWNIGEVALTAEAEQLWRDELYDELSDTDDEDGAWAEFTRRAAPYCRRIAALYAVLAGRQSATTDDLTAAAALVRYSIRSARYVLAGQGGDPDFAKLCRALDEAAEGLTRTEISGIFSRQLKTPVLDELIARAIDTGRYEKVSEPSSGGRPATRYRRCA